jgi:tetratricopeptide (TPR) repeat protein
MRATLPMSLSGLPSFRWALGVAAVSGLAMTLLPMLRALGPESALACALLLSPWASAVGARLALASRRRRTESLLGDALLVGLSLALTCMGVVALAGLFGVRCDPFVGSAFALLGPGISLPLAALAGTFVGASGLSPRLATAVAAALPLVDIARTLWQLLTTPGIFAFGHFYGYFAGTLYDRHAEVPAAWLRHRSLSVCIGIGLACALGALRNRGENRLQLVRCRRAPVASVTAVVCALSALASAPYGAALGFHSDAHFIEASLGRIIRTPRCRAVLPRELDAHEAMRLAEDCELRISQIEARLGITEPGPITAYFFRSIEEKRALMGAYRVYIAKPWRREVYVQLAGFPHPVLGHELAHVVLRSLSRGMFGVPGRLGGLVPEPILVEGAAVAMDPSPGDELTPHELAAAALSLHVAPPLHELLGPRFLARNQALAYTLAGSFLSFLHTRYGNAAFHRIYAGATYEGAVGKPLDALEGEWREFLVEQGATAEAIAQAEQRFERPGVLSEVCPHDVEAAEAELASAVQASDQARVVEAARKVLAIDRTQHGARITLLETLASSGEPAAAQQELDTLQQSLSAPRSTLARAQTALADAALMRGEPLEAAKLYRDLLAKPDSDRETRQREVRLVAATAPANERELLAQILVGSSARGAEPRVALHLLGQLGQLRADGLAPYLEARQLMHTGRPDLSIACVRRALSQGLPTPRLRIEALRMQLQVAFVIGDLALTEHTANMLITSTPKSNAEREARDMLERLRARSGSKTAARP